MWTMSKACIKASYFRLKLNWNLIEHIWNYKICNGYHWSSIVLLSNLMELKIWRINLLCTIQYSEHIGLVSTSAACQTIWSVAEQSGHSGMYQHMNLCTSSCLRDCYAAKQSVCLNYLFFFSWFVLKDIYSKRIVVEVKY